MNPDGGGKGTALRSVWNVRNPFGDVRWSTLANMRYSLTFQAFGQEAPRGLLTNVHEHGNYVVVNGLSLRHKTNIS